MAEATAIRPEGRISVGCPGLWNDEHVAAWRGVTDFIHSQNGRIGVQLAHAGRKASTLRPWDGHVADIEHGGWQTVAPSAVAFDGYPVPRELSIEEIGLIPSQFAEAANRARSAGFDVIEIHAAHGYLLHEFLSPLSNLRNDEYGGSFENRTRLLREVVAQVRVITDAPLFVRISATDWTEGGWDIDESVELAKMLKILGVDLIDVSSGGNVATASIPVGPGYQVPLARRIRLEAEIPVNAVGLITTSEQAEAIVANGDADAVMVARTAMRNPRWPMAVAEELGDVIDWPRQLERARTLPRR
jgi:2,4-dienoyl-CoA reductase-like NADH-dependent reductase (Old Yellow Enzyme family)